MAAHGSGTYIVFNDVPAGSNAVQIRFDGTQKNATEILDLRIDVDYREPSGGFRPVKVAYMWEEVAPAVAAPVPADGKNPAVAEKPHGTVKIHGHVCQKPNDTWTIHCGPGTVAKSYTVELAK